MTSLLDDYRQHAAAYGAHVIAGNADAGNESYDRVQRAFISLVDEGQGNELFRLYDDSDPSVQCWAAAHTLEIDEPTALAKLEELQKAGIPHISTDAKYTIVAWKKSELRFLPP